MMRTPVLPARGGAGSGGPARLASPPPAVGVSLVLWLTALGAGVVETALGAARELFASDGGMGAPTVVLVIAARVVITVVLVALVASMRRGRNRARNALAVLLGGFGLLSLLYEPIAQLAAGSGPAAAFGVTDIWSVVFLAIRAVHVVAVVVALVAMYLPSANRYFRAARH